MPRHETIASLDGLRAVSIIIVVLSHCGLSKVVPGQLGVTIFFFLSGFLITTLLLREHSTNGTISIGQFYARRAFRLMPPLIVTLTMAYSLTYLGFLPGRISLDGFLSQTFYFANYYLISTNGDEAIPLGTGILWSLAVEEHFYIVYPFFLLLLLRSLSTLRQVAAVLGVVCAGILAWRFFLISQPDISALRITFGTDTRADSIVFGCLLAMLRNPIHDLSPGEAMGRRHWLLLAGALGLLLSTIAIRNWHFREGLRFTLQGLALAQLFYLSIRFAHLQPFRLLNTPWMVRLGIWSYAIYLIHDVVVGLVLAWAPAIHARPWFLVPIVTAVSIGFAHLLDRLVEPYFRTLRSRFRPKSSQRQGKALEESGISSTAMAER